MADVQYEFSCGGCKRSFRGTEHSIRGLIGRRAQCTYCKGTFVFPTQFTSGMGAPTTPAASASCPRCGGARQLVWVICPYCGHDYNQVPQEDPLPPPKKGAPRGPPKASKPAKESIAHGVLGDPGFDGPAPDPGFLDPSFLDGSPKKAPKSTPAPPPVRAQAAGGRIAQVDRILARSSGPEDVQVAWIEEFPPVLLQAELMSVIAAAVFLDRFQVQPVHGLALGFGLSTAMFVGAQFYRLLRQGDVPLFRGKGGFLRMVLGPLLLVIAWGSVMAPFHRWVRSKIPVLFTPPAMAGTAALCLSLVGTLQWLHAPLGNLEPEMVEAKKAVEIVKGDVLTAGSAWSGKLFTSSAAGQVQELGIGDALVDLGLGVEELSLVVESVNEGKMQARLNFPNKHARLHIVGLVEDNVAVLVADHVLEGEAVPAWPLGLPIQAAVVNGKLRQIDSGPKFELEMVSAEGASPGEI